MPTEPALHHLVSAEKHLEKAIFELGNGRERQDLDLAYSLIYRVGDRLYPAIIDEKRREACDYMI